MLTIIEGLTEPTGILEFIQDQGGWGAFFILVLVIGMRQVKASERQAVAVEGLAQATSRLHVDLEKTSEQQLTETKELKKCFYRLRDEIEKDRIARREERNRA